MQQNLCFVAIVFKKIPSHQCIDGLYSGNASTTSKPHSEFRDYNHPNEWLAKGCGSRLPDGLHKGVPTSPPPKGGTAFVISTSWCILSSENIYSSFFSARMGGGSWTPVIRALGVPPNRNSLGASWKSLSHEPPSLRHSRTPRAPTIAPMTTLARKMVSKWDPKMESSEP